MSLRRAARERGIGTGRGREGGREGGTESEREGEIAGETTHIGLAYIDALMEAGRGGVARALARCAYWHSSHLSPSLHLSLVLLPGLPTRACTPAYT